MNKIVSSLFIILVLFTVQCRRESATEKIVARVGKEKISFSEVEKSFLLNPKYAVRTPLRLARQSQLQFMIDEIMCYLAAEQSGLRDDPLVQKRVRYIKEQELIKAYIQKNFLDKVELAPEQLHQALSRLARKVRVRHLFVPDLEQAKLLESRLQAGESFEELAREVFSDSRLQASGGDLGYLQFGDLDPALEEKVFSMTVGERSEPVKSVYGYHILEVTDIQQNEQFLELGTPTKLQLIAEVFRARQVDQAVRDHLKTLANDQKIQVNNRVLDRLVEVTQKVMGDRYDEPTIFTPPIFSSDLRRMENELEPILNEELVRFGEKVMSVKDFIERLQEMPPLHRPYLRTRHRMIQSIIDMIRNDLILEEAYRRHMDRDKKLKQSTQRLVQEFLSEEFQKRYYSEVFKNENPRLWEKYHTAITAVKNTQKIRLYTENLFSDVSNPDSIMAPEPLPLFIKSRYQW